MKVLNDMQMEAAYNIKVRFGEEEITLTILEEKDYYKVIYFGGIMAGIKSIGGNWNLIDPESVEADGLPMYIPDHKGVRLEIVLDKHTVDAIGRKIELHKHMEEH